MSATFPFRAVAVLAALGCMGEVGSPDSVDPTASGGSPARPGDPARVPGSPGVAPTPVDVSSLACGSKDAAMAKVDRRLTQVEIQNTLTDLFGPSTFQAIEAQWSTVPQDEYDLDFGAFQRTFSEAHVEGLVTVAMALSGKLSANPEALAGYHKCAGGSIDATCARNLLATLGARAFRRPLLPDEEKHLLDTFASAPGPQGLRMMLAAMVTSPAFLFHLSEDAALTGDVKALANYAIAERISYATIQSLPDPELWQDAQSGRLADEAVRRKHVHRLLTSPRGREATLGFFDHWLRISDIPAPPEAKELVGSLDTMNLPDDLAREAKSYLEYKLYTKQASLKDTYLGREVFAPTPAVAQIYDTKVWNEGTEPPLAPLARGLLLRAPVLAGSQPMPLTILRGVRVARDFLCREIATPGDAIINSRQDKGEAWDPLRQGNRDRVQILTAAPECMSCHSTINPLGFALEDFDPLGRLRSADPVYDDAGSLVATHPLDSSTVVSALDDKPVKGGAELNQSIINHELGRTCFSRQLFRQTLFRQEDLTVEGGDRCHVGATADKLRDEGRPLLDALVEHVSRFAVAPTRVE